MNNYLKEYLKEVNNEQDNFNMINLKINQKRNQKRKILNIAAVLMIIIAISAMTPQIYAKVQQHIIYKEYTRRNYVSGLGKIATAYNEKIDMEYVYQNDIGIKIDSLVLTDDSFKANVNLKLPEEMSPDKLLENKEKNIFLMYAYGYAIYDENNNIYACNDRIDDYFLENGTRNYMKCLYEELGIKYNRRDLLSHHLANEGGITQVEKNNQNIITELHLSSLQGFPNSKKLFIRIYNIGYILENPNEDKPIYYDHNDLEWIFEIETPDKFIKREAINLTLLEEIPKLKIDLFTVSETGMILKGRKKDVVETMAAGKDMKNWEEVNNALINITDEKGNIYYPVSGGTTTEKNGFYSRFEIDKDLFETSELYLNMKIGDKEYSSEIVEE